MFDGDISQIYEVRVRAMSLIGGNLLKTSLLILMSIAHSYSILQISYVLMIPYCGGTDRVVIGSFWDSHVFVNGKESGEWDRDP